MIPTIIISVLLAAYIAFVVVRQVRRAKSGSGCGCGCSTCPSAKECGGHK